MQLNITSWTGVLVGICCLVPGMVYHSVFEIFVSSRTKATDRPLFSVFTTTMVMALVFIPLWSLVDIKIIFSNFTLTWHHCLNYLEVVGIGVLLPAGCAMIWAWMHQKGYRDRVFSWIGLHTIKSQAFAWERAFHGRKTSSVVVVLKNGDCIKGTFGERSLASSDSSCRDLYLEEVYSADNKKLNSEIFINADEIRTVEFV